MNCGSRGSPTSKKNTWSWPRSTLSSPPSARGLAVARQVGVVRLVAVRVRPRERDRAQDLPQLCDAGSKSTTARKSGACAWSPAQTSRVFSVSAGAALVLPPSVQPGRPAAITASSRSAAVVAAPRARRAGRSRSSVGSSEVRPPPTSLDRRAWRTNASSSVTESKPVASPDAMCSARPAKILRVAVAGDAELDHEGALGQRTIVRSVARRPGLGDGHAGAD